MIAVEILRLTHRIHRDIRISSHIALTCRAFNCSKMYYSGQKDSSLENTLIDMNKKFGSSFSIEYEKYPERLIAEKRESGFSIVHLAVYGMPVKEKIKKIMDSKKILIVIGSKHVHGVYYELADYNISVTSQPISELSALSIFLHEYFEGKELDTEFDDAEFRIIGQEKKSCQNNLNDFLPMKSKK